MEKQKTALITGITGQDGSFLAEQLLEKDYKVIGLIRRSSTNNTTNISSLLNDKNLVLVHGDLTDYISINRIFRENKIDECYNMAAQSHVFISFNQPQYTTEVNYLGVMNILDNIQRYSPWTKLYHASSSEMFGNNCSETISNIKYQDENTPFSPQSPYGISKVAAHHLCQLYRKTYGLFICCGILFNHESIPAHSPILIKKDNLIDIIPIEDVFKSEHHRYEGILDKYKNIEIWDGNIWTKVVSGTAYKDDTKSLIGIQTRRSFYEATKEHIAFDKDENEIETQNWKIGNIVSDTKFPINNSNVELDEILAKFIGYLVGDGYISEDGKIRITGNNLEQLHEIIKLVSIPYCWTYREYKSNGGFKKKKQVYNIDLNNDGNFGKWIRSNIYTKSKFKKVPQFILNSSIKIQKAFFDGYYLANGRQAGHERYYYKGFTTNSAVLSMGINFLFNNIFKCDKIKTKMDFKNNKRYYYTQFGNPLFLGNKSKEQNEIIKITKLNNDSGWFYDLQTESQKFVVGPNIFKIHNSPHRSENFVTRKITKYVANLAINKRSEKLHLGNLDASRDWGYSPAYMEVIQIMMNQLQADDYVIGSGETHTVKEFCKKAFAYIGRNYKDYVKIDAKLFRPAEVNYLCANTSKAQLKLGWKYNLTFDELIKKMIEYDIEKLKNNG
jgi:GDPmannose 4,6-dehydratase